MKRFYHCFLWLIWKLFYPIEWHTCPFIQVFSGQESRLRYCSLLAKVKPLSSFADFILKEKGLYPSLKFGFHGINYKQIRREAMWRFLVKGERA